MSLPAEAIAYQQLHIADDRRKDIVIAAAVSLPIAYLAVALRFWSRYVTKAGYRSDDWMIIVGLFFTTAAVADCLIGIRVGLGRHFILLIDPVGFAKNSIASEVLYNPAIATVKISILLLYRRLFQERRFLYFVYAVGAFVLSYTLVAILVCIFQCVPVQSFWNPLLNGKCIDIMTFLTTMGALNIATDIAIIMLPIKILLGLKLSTQTKWQLVGVFSTGALVTIITVIRVKFLADIDLTDPTWSEVDGVIWTIAELCTAVISACLPTLRPLFLGKYQPSLKSSVRKTTQRETDRDWSKMADEVPLHSYGPK